MKRSFKNLILSSLLLVIGLSTVGCARNSSSLPPFVDYASEFKFDETSNRKREVVTVKQAIDGDTVHFNGSFGEFGVVKARFLGVDTPESTGKVEPWGKKASNFTKEKLSTAAEIMVESDSENWDVDSTSERYLLWIWYRPSAGADWKLLNLEILQNGYSKAKGIGETGYAEVFQKALSQAIAHKLNVHSDGKDPDFFYDEAIQLTLSEVRSKLDSYVDAKIQFPALVTRIAGNTAYVEDVDLDTGKVYGMSVYMGYVAYPFIKVGNEVSFIGTLTNSEGFGYQVSGLSYMATMPNYKYNSKLISEGNEVVPTIVTADEVNNGASILSTNVKMENLTVTDVYTTKDGASKGAMTLTCETEDNKTVDVRTEVIYKDDLGKELLTKADVIDKTITINGIVDQFDGDYQVRVFTYDDITFVD